MAYPRALRTKILATALLTFAAAPLASAQGPNCNVRNFCSSLPNSTGSPAIMSSNGDCVVSSNNFELRAQPVPPGEPGIFYYGSLEASVPFGDGVRCIGLAGVGSVFRLFPLTTGDAAGLMTHTVNMTSPPTGGQISAGDTVKFQAWFRDPAAGGASFNLSDGLSVTFATDGSFASDDFNDCGGLDPMWESFDPVGGSSFELVGTGSSDAHLIIDVPGGGAHDAFHANNSARIVQPTANVDFEIEIKFESEPTQNAQFQGILIDEDFTNWIRFDFVRNAQGLRLFAASTVAGFSTVETSQPIPSGNVMYMRVQRTGDDWTQSYSYDGMNWTAAPVFTHALQVQSSGVLAGNSGTPVPPFTCVVDYFYNTADPLPAEDGPVVGVNPRTVTTAVTGMGSIDIQPDQPQYFCGDTLEVSAVPVAGWQFDHWEGSLLGATNPESLSMEVNRSITAVFIVDTLVPPVISNIVAVPTAAGAKITWDTDESATSRADYGLTAGYGQFEANLGTTTSHCVQLTGLELDTTYHFEVTSTDPTMLSAFGGDMTFQTEPGSVFNSDDFNDCAGLQGFWGLWDPVGGSSFDVVGAGTDDAQLHIAVPAGVSHDAFGPNDSARIVQLATDDDFQIEVKFESEPAGGAAFQGILIDEDLFNWLRFDFVSDMSGLNVFAATTVNSSTTARTQMPIASAGPGGPLYMRVKRSGDDWIQSYSYDGALWTELSSFTHAVSVASVGVLAGNSGTPAPAHTAVVDYFWRSVAPTIPEDGPVGGVTPFTLSTQTTGMGEVVVSPDQSTYSCSEVVSVSALADMGWVFDHWEDDLSGSLNPESITVDADKLVTAVFVPGNQPPILSGIVLTPTDTTLLVEWTTDEPATSRVDFGTTMGYGQSVEDLTLALGHSLLLTGLVPAQLYHLEISSTDAGALAAMSGNLTQMTDVGSGLLSDDFNTCGGLTPMWTAVDPLADSAFSVAGQGTDDAHLAISVAGGTNHDAFGTNEAPRVVQTVNDYDFQVKVKFESELTEAFQFQGILVEESAPSQAWLRFDFAHDGTNLNAFAAFTLNGATNILLNTPITSGPVMYLRVTRRANIWTMEHSLDGSGWTIDGVFSQALHVNLVGLMAGNAGNPAPGFTSLVDLFFYTSLPIAPEDGPILGVTPHTLATTTMGMGSVSALPLQASYSCDEIVALTATPDSGWQFDHWEDDLLGSSTNPETLTLDVDRNAKAVFVLDTNPPVLSAIASDPDAMSAKITWTTNEPATSEVDWGTDATYGTTTSDAAFVLDHCIDISGLLPGQTYHFRVRSEDVTMLSSQSGDMTFDTDAGFGFQSDDFNTCIGLDPVWMLVNPLADAIFGLEGGGTDDAHLIINVPSGTAHDAFNTNNAPRAMQSVTNTDFQLEVKFDSAVTEEFQIQGLVIEETAPSQAWLRFDFVSTSGGLSCVAGFTLAGSTTILSNIAIAQADPLWLRVTRAGDLWTQEYSSDGMNWTQAAQFSQPLNVSLAGVFAGNAGAVAPAHRCLVDYVFWTLLPVAPEDGPLPGMTPFTLTTSVTGMGSVETQPDQPTYSCTEIVTLTAVPDPGWQFDHWELDLTGTTNPETLLMDADKSARAVFVTLP